MPTIYLSGLPDCPYFRPPPLLDRFSIFILPPLSTHISFCPESGEEGANAVCAPVRVQGGNSGLAWHAFGAAHLHVVCSTSLFPLHIRVAVQILVHSRRRRRRLGTHVRQPQRRIARPRLSFTIPPPSSEHKSIMPPQYA